MRFYLGSSFTGHFAGNGGSRGGDAGTIHSVYVHLCSVEMTHGGYMEEQSHIKMIKYKRIPMLHTEFVNSSSDYPGLNLQLSLGLINQTRP